MLSAASPKRMRSPTLSLSLVARGRETGFRHPLDQRDLDMGDRLAADADPVEPRRDHPRIVDDDRVARPEEFWQVGDVSVLQRSSGATTSILAASRGRRGASAMRSGGRS